MFINLYSLIGKSAVQSTKPVFSRWDRLTTILYGGKTNCGFNQRNFYSWAVSFLGFVFNSCTMHASQDCVSMRTLKLISSSVIVDRGVIGWGSLRFHVSVSYYIQYKYQIKKSDQTIFNRFSFINTDLLNENKTIRFLFVKHFYSYLIFGFQYHSMRNASDQIYCTVFHCKCQTV